MANFQNFDKFKRHGSGSANGVEVAAGSTKTAFAAKRYNLVVTTLFAAIQSITVFVVTAMKHFVDIFKNSTTNFNGGRNNGIKMVVKDLL